MPPPGTAATLPGFLSDGNRLEIRSVRQQENFASTAATLRPELIHPREKGETSWTLRELAFVIEHR